jgi:Flp pilus assembly protein TadD
LLALSGCAAPLCAQGTPQQRIEPVYKAAEADYGAGRYPAAAHRLETILPYAARDFEVHELLGLIYGSMAENAKALGQLQLAVQLKPDSAAARTNLGTILLDSGKADLASEQFRKALQLEPTNYDANHNLGELYVKSGQVAESAGAVCKSLPRETRCVRQRLRSGHGRFSARPAGRSPAGHQGSGKREKKR